jgi:hypothetical protein
MEWNHWTFTSLHCTVCILRVSNCVLQDGESPSEKVTINGKTVEIDSWARLCQLDIFRQVLNQGFQLHCKVNAGL